MVRTLREILILLIIGGGIVCLFWSWNTEPPSFRAREVREEFITDTARIARLCNALHATEEVTAACTARRVLTSEAMLSYCNAHLGSRDGQVWTNCMSRVTRLLRDDRPLPGPAPR